MTQRRAPSRRPAAALVVAAALLAGPAVAAAPSESAAPRPSSNPAAVLERFLGDWTTETAIRDAAGTEHRTRGRATCRRTLAGRYFEFRSESVPPGEADLQIMTWDGATGVYRQWVFDADGYRHEAEGRWEPATATLTWTGRTKTGAFAIVDRWVSPDRLEWTLEGRDRDGRIARTISGTLERRAAAPRGAP